jgi:xanthine/CO dehydrogenase XdhC/CoxF family maturation factor
MNDAFEILSQARTWRHEGRAVAIATVVATWNSSPRQVGAKLAVDDRGHMSGSVSGGCVEGAVVEAALEVMQTRTPRLLEFGIADADAFAVGLACGGRVQIFVEALE